MNTTNYYITSIDHIKLYVQEFGSGKPLIFLSGGPGFNPVYMKPIWERLSAQYRCIILNQRGTGKSRLSYVDAAVIDLDNYVHDLEVLRHHLKLEQLLLMGQSWGGMLSMEYAAKHPLQTEKLILLGTGGPTGKFLSYFKDNIIMRLHKEEIEEVLRLESMAPPDLSAILPVVWPGYFFDRKRGLATKNVVDEDFFGQLEVNRYAMPNYISTATTRVDLLKHYKGDVHIIQGRQDPMGESTVYEINDILPQAQIHFIEKCGHLPWLENDIQVEEFFAMLFSCIQ